MWLNREFYGENTCSSIKKWAEVIRKFKKACGVECENMVRDKDGEEKR